MALTPILYTKNWKDTFGSQSAPADQVNASVPPTVSVPNVSQRTAAFNLTYPIQCTIDWGDGTVQLDQNAGAKTHDYAADGSYVITVANENYADCFTQHTVRIAKGPTTLNVDVAAALLDVTATITGAVYPITFDWGDGTTQFVSSPNALDNAHTYEAAGTYIVSVFDSLARRNSESVTVSETTGFVVTPEMLAALHNHAQLNAFVEDNDLEVIPAWFQMTVAEKKAWLLEEYGA